MAELILEPYAAQQHWQAASSDVPWQTVLGNYLENIARGCAENESCVIGHIKALALFPDGSYLRLSVVSPTQPASVEGNAPPNCATMTLSLNVIVYGIERSRLEQIAHAAAADLPARWKGVVTTESN